MYREFITISLVLYTLGLAHAVAGNKAWNCEREMNNASEGVLNDSTSKKCSKSWKNCSHCAKHKKPMNLEQRVEFISSKYNLNASQKSQLKAAFEKREKTNDSLFSAMKSIKSKQEELRAADHQDLFSIFTPEQKARWEKDHPHWEKKGNK